MLDLAKTPNRSIDSLPSGLYLPRWLFPVSTHTTAVVCSCEKGWGQCESLSCFLSSLLSLSLFFYLFYNSTSATAWELRGSAYFPMHHPNHICLPPKCGILIAWVNRGRIHWRRWLSTYSSVYLCIIDASIFSLCSSILQLWIGSCYIRGLLVHSCPSYV